MWECVVIAFGYAFVADIACFCGALAFDSDHFLGFNQMLASDAVSLSTSKFMSPLAPITFNNWFDAAMRAEVGVTAESVECTSVAGLLQAVSRTLDLGDFQNALLTRDPALAALIVDDPDAAAPGLITGYKALSELWYWTYSPLLNRRNSAFLGKALSTSLGAAITTIFPDSVELTATYNNPLFCGTTVSGNARVQFAKQKNTISITTLTNYHGVKLFFSGDATTDTFFTVKNSQTAIGLVDFYKAAHHGSATTGAIDDFDSVWSNVYVVSGKSALPYLKQPDMVYIGWIVHKHLINNLPAPTIYITNTPADITLLSGPTVNGNVCNYRLYALGPTSAALRFETPMAGDPGTVPNIAVADGVSVIPIFATPGRTAACTLVNNDFTL
ncbi:hypothetical protein BDZ88DRAFT_419176 [Geranomyces variabilis]|nr:hypothetical protein BDZ88DRAFT_419176 [Geranomyces variabilis]